MACTSTGIKVVPDKGEVGELNQNQVNLRKKISLNIVPLVAFGNKQTPIIRNDRALWKLRCVGKLAFLRLMNQRKNT